LAVIKRSNRSRVASKMAEAVLASAVVAPRTPRQTGYGPGRLELEFTFGTVADTPLPLAENKKSAGWLPCACCDFLFFRAVRSSDWLPAPTLRGSRPQSSSTQSS
jgi:hypothetical protein